MAPFSWGIQLAVLWQSAPVPWFNPATRQPAAGAQAFFYDADTTTPMVVYQDGALGISWDQPVLADGNGVFPAVFLPPNAYHLRVEDAGGSTIWDVDNIDAPQAATYVPPDAGSTDPTLLVSTGMIIARHSTSTLTGWVRANGKSIGNASSGATERANADASALFQFLWAADSTLAVSGGRGGTAAGDFAAGKRIDLPNYINRTLAGLVMGGTDPSILASALVDNSETNDTLGATVGASTHALTTAELAVHTHTGHGAVTDPGHSHTIPSSRQGMLPQSPASADNLSGTGANPAGVASTATTGITVAVTNDNAGSGTAHINMQPSVLVTYYLKL